MLLIVIPASTDSILTPKTIHNVILSGSASHLPAAGYQHSILVPKYISCTLTIRFDHLDLPRNEDNEKKDRGAFSLLPPLKWSSRNLKLGGGVGIEDLTNGIEFILLSLPATVGESSGIAGVHIELEFSGGTRDALPLTPMWVACESSDQTPLSLETTPASSSASDGLEMEGHSVAVDADVFFRPNFSSLLRPLGDSFMVMGGAET
jgi:hypothetical protein